MSGTGLAAVVVLGAVVLRSAPHGVSPADQARSALVGVGAAAALALYLLVAHEELLANAVVLASLYPASPVLLGITVHREKVTMLRTLGLVGAGVAVVLLSGG